MDFKPCPQDYAKRIEKETHRKDDRADLSPLKGARRLSIALRGDNFIGSIDDLLDVDENYGGFGRVARGGFLQIRGWLLSQHPLKPVDMLSIGIAGSSGREAVLGLPRPDVCDAFGTRALASGFAAVIPVDAPIGQCCLAMTARVDGYEGTVQPTDALLVVPPRNPFRGLEPRANGWNFAIDGIYLQDDSAVELDAEGVFVIPLNAPAHLRLWAIDTVTLRAPREVVARRGGRYLAVKSGIARADAATSLSAPLATMCGFSVPLLPAPIGIEEVTIYAIDGDGVYANIASIRMRQPDPLPSSALPMTADMIGALDEMIVGGVTADPRSAIAAVAGQRIRLRGWTVDAVGPRLAGGIEVLIDGTCVSATQTKRPRPDITATIGDGVADCEFDITFVLPNLPPGAHALTVRTFSSRRDATADLEQIELRIQSRPPG